MAAAGALFGMGCVAASRLLPIPSVASGALCGVGLWFGSEQLYRLQPDRQQKWAAPPFGRALHFGAFGVAVALVADLP
jgi:hypothetical protein